MAELVTAPWGGAAAWVLCAPCSSHCRLRDPRSEAQTPLSVTQPAFIFSRRRTLYCIKFCLLREWGGSHASQPGSLWDKSLQTFSPPACAWSRSMEWSRGREERSAQICPREGLPSWEGLLSQSSSGIPGHARTGEQDSCMLQFLSINERNAKNSLCFWGKRCVDASSSELDPQGREWGNPQQFVIGTWEIHPHPRELLMSGETDISHQCRVTVPHPLPLAGTGAPPGASPAQGNWISLSNGVFAA